jgi:GT2 family glycosyltransferase
MKKYQPRQASLFPVPAARAEISVIVPMDRTGEDALRSVQAVLAQQTRRPFEVIVVSGVHVELPDDPRIRLVLLPDRNPAVRRNRGAKVASGSILAFTDDDAFPESDWLENGALRLEEAPDILAVGGPDPSPDDAPVSELLSDTLLATPWIGSGIAAHESRASRFEVKAPYDVALVNLFVSADAFRDAGGFDTSIGYIGEDTDLVARLLEKGRVVYDPAVVVRHRKRAFPRPYLRQRWRYRLKTGEMLVRGSRSYRRSGKIAIFLAAGVAAVLIAVMSPPLAASGLLLYCAGVLVLAARRTRLPLRWWWLIPPAFLLHHGIYFAGIAAGIFRGLFTRNRQPDGSAR